eukprot:scaffold127195_cov24-Tisochrysis_lutea.AAC.1
MDQIKTFLPVSISALPVNMLVKDWCCQALPIPSASQNPVCHDKGSALAYSAMSCITLCSAT